MKNFITLILFSTLFMVSALFAQDASVSEEDLFFEFERSFLSNSLFDGGTKDPFRKIPGLAKASKEDKVDKGLNVEEFQLDGVMQDGDNSIAIINDQQVFQGQYIDEDHYVTEIGENYVIISNNDKEIDIVLPMAEEPEVLEMSEGSRGVANEKN